MDIENNQCSRLLKAFQHFGRLKLFFPQKEDLPQGEFFMLHNISYCQKKEGGQVRISAISGYTHMSMPAVSQMLNALEGKGMIERRMDSKDRRSVFVNVTKKGETLMQDAMRTVNAMMAEVEERLGKEDTDQFIEIFTRLVAITEEIKNRESVKTEEEGKKQ